MQTNKNFPQHSKKTPSSSVRNSRIPPQSDLQNFNLLYAPSYHTLIPKNSFMLAQTLYPDDPNPLKPADPEIPTIPNQKPSDINWGVDANKAEQYTAQRMFLSGPKSPLV